MKNIHITPNYIVVGKNEYRLNRIEHVWIKKLAVSCQFLRLLVSMLQFSSVGWLAQYWIGMTGVGFYLPTLLSVAGLFYALVTFRKFELKALLSAVDETGKQPITIATAIKSNDYKVLQYIEHNWQQVGSHNKILTSDS